jgi:hypothetical protein
MNSSVTHSFRRQYAQLPETVQQQARKQYRLWMKNAGHPSLHFKKVKDLWSVRIDRSHRALAFEQNGTLYWFYIGTHDGYEAQINR